MSAGSPHKSSSAYPADDHHSQSQRPQRSPTPPPRSPRGGGDRGGRSPPPRSDRGRSPSSRSRSRSPRDRGHRGRSYSRSPPPRSGERGHSSNPKGDTLYITGLSLRTREPDIERKFSPYGGVVSVSIVKDPRTRESRGFAFVTMESAAAADYALEKTNRTDLDGRSIVVEKSKRNRPRSPTPGHYMGQDRNRRRSGPSRGYPSGGAYGGAYIGYGGGYGAYGGYYGGGGGYAGGGYGSGYSERYHPYRSGGGGSSRRSPSPGYGRRSPSPGYSRRSRRSRSRSPRRS